MKHEESRKRNAEAITSYLCGETKESICNRLGIREDRFYSMCYVKGIKVVNEIRVKQLSDRTIAIIEAFKQGKTLEEIGEQYKISRERVRQILKIEGITSKQGGAHIRRLDSEKSQTIAIKEKKNKKCIATYGCTTDELTRLNDGEISSKKQSKAQKFKKQLNNARLRGVVFNLTFPQWVAVWEESGLYDARGRGKSGYCMARYGNTGAYEIGNVYIASVIENSRDGIKVAHDNNKKFNRINNRCGKGKGWVRNARGRYEAKFRNKYIGSFKTQVEAEMCYKKAVTEYLSQNKAKAEAAGVQA